MFAVLLGLLMIGVTAGSAVAMPSFGTPVHSVPFETKNDPPSLNVEPHVSTVRNNILPPLPPEKLDPISPQSFGDKDDLSMKIDYFVDELSNGDLLVSVYYGWTWKSTEIFNGPDDQVVILIPYAYWKDGKWVTFFREPKPTVLTNLGKANIRDISFLVATVNGKYIQVARIIATVNDDVAAEGVWVYMTLKKEYSGLEIKTNFIYLHSWGTGTGVSTIGSLTLPFLLYFAPAGLNLAASVGWTAADLFIFQRFDGSWKKTETKTLVLYPESNLPPCFNGICPTSIGGPSNGLD
ncbi:hypothetical protein [Thermococcus sp.]|uniref:hypothetical protein n=1 Tax=Thermococcus sp. TaxID=35749 RepID=UPI0025EBD67A|nr:hypothetical protein [Thermococcus sp.]